MALLSSINDLVRIPLMGIYALCYVYVCVRAGRIAALQLQLHFQIQQLRWLFISHVVSFSHIIMWSVGFVRTCIKIGSVSAFPTMRNITQLRTLKPLTHINIQSLSKLTSLHAYDAIVSIPVASANPFYDFELFPFYAEQKIRN